MSGQCSIAKCNRQSHVLCHGCQSNFCREHLLEHCHSIHLQLNPLIERVNQIDADLRKLDPIDIFTVSFEKLEEWRQEAHALVDKYFTEKLQKLDVYLQNKLKLLEKDVRDTQEDILLFKKDQETSHEQIQSLTYQIENLKKSFAKIKLNEMYLHANPLTIKEDLITFEKSLDVSVLPPVYRIINQAEKSYSSLATNKQLLLLHHDGALLAVDKELTTYRKTPWTHGPIFDMCYSSILDRFIIINEHEVFLFDEPKIVIEKVRSIPWQRWFSCTCSDVSLYLTTRVYNSSLIQYHLKPKIEFLRKWPPALVCAKDEDIDAIVYNNNTLALIISNDREESRRLELKSTITMWKIWSLRLDIAHVQTQAFRFCLVNTNEWLVVDHKNSRLLHISKDGKIKATSSYQSPPYCAVEFGNDMLAISTRSVVNLHKF